MAKHSKKIFLVTGGTSGIGAATVKTLSEEGATIIATASSTKSVEEAKAKMPDSNIEFLVSDMGNAKSIDDLVQYITKKYGSLNGIVFNAAYTCFMPIESWDDENFDKSFAVNVKGPYFLLQKLLPILSDESSILFTSTMFIEGGAVGASVYSATKSALLSFAKNLAIELAPRDIRVNCVSPGSIETPVYEKLGLDEVQAEDFKKRNSRRIPLGHHFGEPADIAHAFSFLLSAEAKYITGTNLVVDGGWVNNLM